MTATIDDSDGFQKSLDEMDKMIRDDFPGSWNDPDLDDFLAGERDKGASEWISKTLTGLLYAEKNNPVALKKAVERVEAQTLRNYRHARRHRESDQHDENADIVLNLLHFIKKGLE